MFKIKKFWMGPDEKVFNEGFDDLFKVEEDYKIPPPSGEAKARMSAMTQESISPLNNGMDDKQGFDLAMDSVFGSRKEVAQQQAAPAQAATQTKSFSPLSVVQQGANGMNIVVTEPRSFEDALEIANHVKERKSVIVNLQYLDKEISQRVIDFVSGATLAVDGSQERIGHGVFIFAAMNTSVETESDSIRAYKDLFTKTFG